MLKKKSLFFVTTIFIVLSVLMTACGGTSNTNSGATTPKEKDTKATAEGFRSFETKKGVVNIPVKPKRIVTDFYGGELLSVGANVVGVEPTTFKNPFLTDLLKSVTDIGEPISTEKTLQLKPDLIVVMKDENYEALSKIAPTLHIPYGTATNIYETVRLFGDIAGEKEKAEKFIAAYDQKAADGR